MAGLHSIRKRMSHATQTKKSVSKGMSSSYTSEKARLEADIMKLRTCLKQVEQDGSGWQSALKAERVLCGTLASGLEQGCSGSLLKRGAEKLEVANGNLASVHDEVYTERMEGVTKHIKEMGEVEGVLAERERYEKKVEKLGKGKMGEKVKRNVAKLQKATEKFDKAEGEIVERARQTGEEFVEAVESLAKAFWGRRETVLREIGSGSEELRVWAVGKEGMKEEVKEEAYF